MYDGQGVFSLLDGKRNYFTYERRLNNRLLSFNSELSILKEDSPLRQKLLSRIPTAQKELVEEITEILERAHPGEVEIRLILKARYRDIHTDKKYGFVDIFTANAGKTELTFIPSQYSNKVLVVFLEGFNVQIHYPKLTIRNSQGFEHTLKDMFITFKLLVTATDENNYSFSIGTLRGTRTTLSVEELASGYIHSHISHFTINTFEPQGFCYGHGVMAEIVDQHFNGDRRKVLAKVKVFIRQLKAYLEWESIEGHPYKYMADVLSKESLDKVPIPEELLREAWSIINELDESLLNIDWELGEKGFRIVDNDKFEAFLKSSLQRRLTALVDGRNSLRGASVMVNKDIYGNYFKRRDSQFDEEIKVHNTKYITFKEEKKYLTIQGHSTVQNIKTKSCIHPKIKHYVKTRLEVILNNAKTQEAGVRRVNQGSNT